MNENHRIFAPSKEQIRAKRIKYLILFVAQGYWFWLLIDYIYPLFLSHTWLGYQLNRMVD